MDSDRRIDDLSDAQMDGNGGERHCLRAAEMVGSLEVVQHAVEGNLLRLIQGLAEADGKPAGGRLCGGHGEGQVSTQVKAERDAAHRTLDGQPRDLAIALSGVAVADGEEGARDLDGQPESATRDQLAAVEVATSLARWDGGVRTRCGGRVAHDAHEGANGDGETEAIGVAGASAFSVKVPADDNFVLQAQPVA